MRQHPQFAYEMLKAVLASSAAIPRYCVTAITRNGMAQVIRAGLNGERFRWRRVSLRLWTCRDALTSDRPYRKAWTRQQALTYLREQSANISIPRWLKVFIQKLESDSI